MTAWAGGLPRRPPLAALGSEPQLWAQIKPLPLRRTRDRKNLINSGTGQFFSGFLAAGKLIINTLIETFSTSDMYWIELLNYQCQARFLIQTVWLIILWITISKKRSFVGISFKMLYYRYMVCIPTFFINHINY